MHAHTQELGWRSKDKYFNTRLIFKEIKGNTWDTEMKAETKPRLMKESRCLRDPESFSWNTGPQTWSLRWALGTRDVSMDLCETRRDKAPFIKPGGWNFLKGLGAKHLITCQEVTFNLSRVCRNKSICLHHQKVGIWIYMHNVGYHIQRTYTIIQSQRQVHTCNPCILGAEVGL